MPFWYYLEYGSLLNITTTLSIKSELEPKPLFTIVPTQPLWSDLEHGPIKTIPLPMTLNLDLNLGLTCIIWLLCLMNILIIFNISFNDLPAFYTLEVPFLFLIPHGWNLCYSQFLSVKNKIEYS